IQREPFLKPRFAISLDGIDGAFRFANATVDAFVRMDDEHVLALVEAVHGAHLDAVHGFAANAAIVDDVGQLGVLPADCRGQLICAIGVLARWPKMDAQLVVAASIMRWNSGRRSSVADTPGSTKSATISQPRDAQ